ncbi:MAG: hypothetical protein H2184_08900 [Candidatus Galacturonibacter soehngenii]|nr:hypothetical protein [Candidatus Galacturonibacter soehngenii]
MKKICIILMAVIVLSGCVQQTNLTQQESEAIAAYAANITLKYDKNYKKKLVNTDAELVKSEEDAVQEKANDFDNDMMTNEAINQEATTQETQDEQVKVQEESISQLLQLDGFQITYEGFLYSQHLEDISAGNSYTANSLDNNEFLIMNFRVENTTDETKICDVLSMSPSLKVSINGNEPINSFASLLSNDLSTLYEEMEAHASKNVVLLIEIPQDYGKDITSVSLTVTVAGKTSTIELN